MPRMIKLALPGRSEKFSFEDNLSIEDFIKYISEKTNIHTNSIEIWSGYPLVRKSDLWPNDLLCNIIESGAVITIREGKESSMEHNLHNHSNQKEETKCSSSIQSLSADEMAFMRSKLAFPDHIIAQALDICGSEDIELLAEVCSQISSSFTPSLPEEKYVRHEIEADNSCLFNSILYSVKDTVEYSSPADLRSLIASMVLSDPSTYHEAFLGKPGEEYAAWIMQPKTWGGEIELSILARCLQVQIGAVDIKTGNLYVYSDKAESHTGTTEEAKKEIVASRVYLLYDGIHYDAVEKVVSSQANSARVIHKFSSEDEEAVKGVKELADGLRAKKLYVDIHSFTLQCNACSLKLKGQKEALEHAKSTGHADFGGRNKPSS